MSELPDRDAINALFAGNYADPFFVTRDAPNSARP